MLFRGLTSAAVCVVLVAGVLVTAGCGGSSSEDIAIEGARDFLETEDGLLSPVFSELNWHRRGSREVWRVEFESDWGHRCVDMTSSPRPRSAAAFSLVRIKSGPRCERLHFDLATGERHGLYWSDLSAEAKAAYRRGFLTCRHFRLTEPPAHASRDQDRYLSEREFPRVTVVEAAENYGCSDENRREPLPGSGLPAGFV